MMKIYEDRYSYAVNRKISHAVLSDILDGVNLDYKSLRHRYSYLFDDDLNKTANRNGLIPVYIIEKPISEVCLIGPRMIQYGVDSYKTFRVKYKSFRKFSGKMYVPTCVTFGLKSSESFITLRRFTNVPLGVSNKFRRLL